MALRFLAVVLLAPNVLKKLPNRLILPFFADFHAASSSEYDEGEALGVSASKPFAVVNSP